MVDLTPQEEADLAGANGYPVQWAMRLLITLADACGASELIPISQAHLVGAYHSGSANIALLDRLIADGAQVRVPTSLNSSSADLSTKFMSCHWKQEQAEARAVVQRLVQIGCRATLTCSPYFLPTRPSFGDVIAWAESNAVLYANSVLGARSLKSPQFFDLACALTGKTLRTGVVCDVGRRPELVIDASGLTNRWFDDELGYQLVGYVTGEIAGDRIALIKGLPPTRDEAALQGFCASAGVSGSMALIHAEGLTPEASQFGDRLHSLEVHCLSDTIINDTAAKWSLGDGHAIAAVCLGAPHFGIQQILALDAILDARGGTVQVPTYVAVSRDLEANPETHRSIQRLKSRGVSIVHDTCTYYGSLLGKDPGTVATNSVKWASYGAANLGARPALMNLANCGMAAVWGPIPKMAQREPPNANN
ncbi:MAG: aconitase X [Pseudomonadota bacterium]